jgi:hypothetical protein
VAILYLNGEGKKFDMDYYASTHMPLVARLLGDSLKFLESTKAYAAEPRPTLFLIWQ